MITKLATPGVYVDEVPMLPPSVAEVESAIPAFVGYTEKAVYGFNVPMKVTSMDDFTALFGGGPNEDETKVSVEVDKVTVGGVEQYKVMLDITAISKNILWYAMKHFFDNGGGTCYVVSVAAFKDPDKDELIAGIKTLEDFDEPTMLLCPEASRLADSATSNAVMQKMIQQAVLLKDRIALVDVFDVLPNLLTKKLSIDKDVKDFRDTIGVSNEEGRYAAAYYPNLETNYSYNFDFGAIVIKTYKENGVAPAPTPIPDNTPLNSPSLGGSVVYNAVKTAFERKHVVLPPSAAIAGVITNVDNTRGYWKAPANVTVKSVVSPTIILSDRQQDSLNIDVMMGKSVNVIRQFPGQGNVVWGARTLDGNSNEWRYVNVRRFFMVVEESIKKSINWAVFEPNTAQTWVLVQSMIENYLFLKWRDGALAGTKPEDAFFVRIGINKTMTPQDILEGKMIVEIGMAVARPAEFIVLKFMQLMQKS
jgi:uncharacterized protein